MPPACGIVALVGLAAGVIASTNGRIPEGFFQGCESWLVLFDRVFGAFFGSNDEIFETSPLQSGHRDPPLILSGFMLMAVIGWGRFCSGLFHVPCVL